MFGTENLWLFIVSGLLLNIAPGPDSLLIMSRSASQGIKAGLAATLGIGAGTCLHIAAAAFGISALLATSAEAFFVVKMLGALYLCYLGVQMLRPREATQSNSRASDVAQGDSALLNSTIAVDVGAQQANHTAITSSNAATARPAYGQIFCQGAITNLLNPKVALFFLAFVPQFIASDAPSKAISFIFLGLVFNVNGMLWCSFLAWSAAYASKKVAVSNRLKSYLSKSIGALFVALGVKLALSKASS